MGLADIKPYFRTRLDGLGYSEWVDGFQVNNIPEQIIDKAYHIYISRTDGGAINHTHQDSVSEVRVRIIFKGYRDATEAHDTAIAGVELIIQDVCNIVNRTSTLFNVVFDSCEFNPLNDLNDNSVLVEMIFAAQVIIAVEQC